MVNLNKIICEKYFQSNSNLYFNIRQTQRNDMSGVLPRSRNLLRKMLMELRDSILLKKVIINIKILFIKLNFNYDN